MTMTATAATSPAGGLLRVLACCLGLGAACVTALPAVAVQAPAGERPAVPGASADVRGLAAWVTASGDNQRLSFVIVDKPRARIFVFHSDGRLRGAAPALLGAARGDESVPGIGDRKLEAIRPQERTTPAGRFVAALGNDAGEEEVVWVDYADAVSLHRVITTNPKEHRLRRLATPTPLDNRISYGCINVPAKFFDDVVRPAFRGAKGVVYILPEIRPIADVFPAYALYERQRGSKATAQGQAR